MIAAATIEQILAQYKKHGWRLSRVLLSAGLRGSLADPASLFGDVPLAASDLDAAWFSRSSRPGSVAWEIRHLSDTPFAIVVAINDGTAGEAAEAVLSDAEERMKSAVAGRPASD